MTNRSQQRRKSWRVIVAFRSLILSALAEMPSAVEDIIDAFEQSGYRGARRHAESLYRVIADGYNTPGLTMLAADSVRYWARKRGNLARPSQQMLRERVTTGCRVTDSLSMTYEFRQDIYLLTQYSSAELTVFKCVIEASKTMQRAVSWFPDPLMLQKGSTQTLLKTGSMQRSEMRRLTKKAREIKFELRESDDLLNIFVPNEVDVHLDGAFDAESYLLLLPYINPDTKLADGWDYIDDGAIRRFREQHGSRTFSMSRELYERLVYLNQAVHIRNYVLATSKKIAGRAREALVCFSDETKKFYVCSAALYSAVQIVTLKKNFDLIAIQKDLRENYTDCDSALIDAVIKLCVIQTKVALCQEFLGVEAFSSWSVLPKLLLTVPVRALGKLALDWTIAGLDSSGFSNHYVFLSEPELETRAVDFLYEVNFNEQYGKPTLSGNARLLVETIDRINGFAAHFATTIRQFVYYTSDAESITDFASVDALTCLNLLAAELDATHITSYPEWQEQFINTGELPFAFPEALKIKIHPMLFEYQPKAMHLPKTFCKEVHRQMDMISTLRALNTRNLGTAHLSSGIDARRWFEENIDAVGDLSFVENWRDLVKEYQANPIAVDVRSIENYVQRMPPEKVQKYLDAPLLPLEDVDYAEFMMILKNVAKDQAPTSGKVSDPQTVIFYAPESGASNQPLWEEGMTRFVKLLKPNFFVSDRLPNTEIEKRFDLFAKGESISIQNDIGSFDKSETRDPLIIERCVYELLGMPHDFLEMWFGSNVRIVARLISGCMKVEIAEQRRSGQGPTLFGNLLVCFWCEMLTGGYLLPQNSGKIQLVWWQGDDVNVVVDPTFEVPTNSESRALDLMNLSGKRQIFDHNYCCSRLVIRVGGRHVLVYDPFKMIAKFSRALSPREYGDLDKKWQSYQELIQNYDSLEVREQVADAMQQIYGVERGQTRIAMIASLNACRTPETLRSLWCPESVKR